MTGFAVIGCSHCSDLWAVDLRHEQATCPRCRKTFKLADRHRLWQGEGARAAQAAAAALRAGGQEVAPPNKTPRHDSPVEAAAAQAVGIINKSRKAEVVALWLTRLTGLVPHADLVAGMEFAGLERDRAEREVVRMLATDILTEPRAGSYRVLDA